MGSEARLGLGSDDDVAATASRTPYA